MTPDNNDHRHENSSPFAVTHCVVHLRKERTMHERSAKNATTAIAMTQKCRDDQKRVHTRANDGEIDTVTEATYLLAP
jgi:hypothetical protein